MSSTPARSGVPSPEEAAPYYFKYIDRVGGGDGLGFLAYSAWCSRREDLFRSLAAMARLHWGRQVGLDLYLGLGLSLGLMCLHEQSLLVVLAWLLPVLLFANLATLLYFAIHYDAIVARFLG